MMKFFLLASLLAPFLARANYLSYVDDKGTKHIVETPSEIPEKYRKEAKQTTAGKKGAAASATSTDSDTAGAPIPKPPLQAPKGSTP